MTETYLTDALISGNAKSTIVLLQRQLKVAEALGNNTLMIRDLIENTTRLQKRISTYEDHKFFEIWVKQLSKSLGEKNKYYWLELAILRSKAKLKPAQAEEFLQNIRTEFPENAEAYRDVVEFAVLTKNRETLRKWCSDFLQAPFPSLPSHPISYYGLKNQKSGTLRLSAFGNGSTQHIGATTIMLRPNVPITFEYPLIPEQDYFEFKYRVLPGLALTLKSITFIDYQNKRVKFSADNLAMISEQGFFVGNDTLIMNSLYKEDSVKFVPLKAKFPASYKIIFDVVLKRMNISSHPDCLLRNLTR